MEPRGHSEFVRKLVDPGRGRPDETDPYTNRNQAAGSRLPESLHGTVVASVSTSLSASPGPTSGRYRAVSSTGTRSNRVAADGSGVEWAIPPFPPLREALVAWPCSSGPLQFARPYRRDAGQPRVGGRTAYERRTTIYAASSPGTAVSGARARVPGRERRSG
ncbi:hypothetical protein C485_14335 [Natrinema altunense JCM 12890]|uniref:Uncharacterized protein n=1 Tax=Natrinema altunense (strain JCM 12890 / CGMCC 1.3731 / AJ2) TaxID=1227494 RepID=L9ZHD1_NATA2|nr:hypothetical protein C485_14335 [Natrinema altunense JCM 12890]